MKKTVQRFRKLLLLAFLAAGLMFPSQVFAEHYDCDVSIPVTMQVTGDASEDSYEVVIEAADKESGAFMPALTSLSMKNGETKAFGPIHYEEPGDFHYTIYQKSGTSPDMIYDTTIYHVTVRVSNAGDNASDGMKAQLWVNRNDSLEKIDKLEFLNTQKEEPETSPEEESDTTSESETDKPGGGTSTDSVQTGDNENPMLWLMLVLVSAAVILLSVVLRQRKKNH